MTLSFKFVLVAARGSDRKRDMSLKEAAHKAHAAGLTYPKSGAKVPVSTVHTILRNRLYTGWFEWNDKRVRASTRH